MRQVDWERLRTLRIAEVRQEFFEYARSIDQEISALKRILNDAKFQVMTAEGPSVYHLQGYIEALEEAIERLEDSDE